MAHRVCACSLYAIVSPAAPCALLPSICLQSDLALLTVPEEAFWTDLRPLEFLTEMPELQARCCQDVYGEASSRPTLVPPYSQQHAPAEDCWE